MTPSCLRCRLSQRGFTLVELMVALALSLILATALLTMQVTLGQQSVDNADISVRDGQTRAAMDLITRDLSSAGFMFAGNQNYCNVLLTYDNGTTFAHHPVDAVSAGAGTASGFAPGLTLNYPPAGSGVPSDVLVTSGSNVQTDFTDGTYPLQYTTANPALSPMNAGIVPMAATTGLTAGDVGVLQVPVSGMFACMRVPLTAVTTTQVSSAGSGSPSLMPTNFYTGFSSQLAGAGFSDTLSDAQIYAHAAMIDIGNPGAATPNQTMVAYYIDNSGAFPVLMRGVYSLLNDQLIATQSVAAGVVSLQIRFGVDPGGTGAVTDYETSAQVTANRYWNFVRSVKVALVTRTLADDPRMVANRTTWPIPITIGAPFPPLTEPASYRHFSVQQTEIAARNQLWN